MKALESIKTSMEWRVSRRRSLKRNPLRAWGLDGFEVAIIPVAFRPVCQNTLAMPTIKTAGVMVNGRFTSIYDATVANPPLNRAQRRANQK